jgi:hypothetical protein
MKKINYKSILVFSIVLVLLLVGGDLLAQCPMCKMSLQSNLQNGGSQGSGINAGIMYLLMTPYLIVGGIAYVWYRNRKKKVDIILEEELATV